MSPRRKFAPGERPLLVARPVRPPRGWLLPLAGTAAALLMVTAVTLCALMLVSHESRERAASKDREVLSYVSGFMTQFTSIDPFHANDYVNRILAQATGDFAKQYEKNANEILLQVARAELATGTVLTPDWNGGTTTAAPMSWWPRQSPPSRRMRNRCWRTPTVGRQPPRRKGTSGRSAACSR